MAWDPVKQAAVWRMPNPGLVNGGVLSTGGDLVFQGDNDGRFNAYDAMSGRKLWSFDGQSAIMAAPATYTVNGRQYLTVLAGFGGAVALIGGEAAWQDGAPRVNKSRVLTFALDGTAPPLPPLVRPPHAPVTAPAQTAGPQAIAAGRVRYLNTCVVCHGANAVSAGLLPA